MKGNLSRADAVNLARAVLAAHRITDSPGLNAQDVGGLDRGDQSVAFEYIAEREVLNVLALCYRFRKPPRPGVLQGFRDEQKRGTDTGGGLVEFRPDNADSGGLFLSRCYTEPTDPERFIEDTARLMRAAKYWAEEVLPAVAARVFGHDE